MQKIFILIILLTTSIVCFSSCSDSGEYLSIDDPTKDIPLSDNLVNLSIECYFLNAFIKISNYNTNFDPLIISNIDVDFRWSGNSMNYVTVQMSSNDTFTTNFSFPILIPPNSGVTLLYDYSVDIQLSSLDAGDTFDVNINMIDFYYADISNIFHIDTIRDWDHSFNVIAQKL